MLIRSLYTVFIGILFTVLVGVGIAAFYKQPKAPEYPIELSTRFPDKEPSTQSAELHTKQIAYERKSREFQKTIEDYSRNVSVVAMGFAVVFVLLGLILARSMPIFPDGLLVGSLGTLLYSIVRGFNAQDDMFRFVIVAVSLIISLVIGYMKFINPQHTSK